VNVGGKSNGDGVADGAGLMRDGDKDAEDRQTDEGDQGKERELARRLEEAEKERDAQRELIRMLQARLGEARDGNLEVSNGHGALLDPVSGCSSVDAVSSAPVSSSSVAAKNEIELLHEALYGGDGHAAWAHVSAGASGTRQRRDGHARELLSHTHKSSVASGNGNGVMSNGPASAATGQSDAGAVGSPLVLKTEEAHVSAHAGHAPATRSDDLACISITQERRTVVMVPKLNLPGVPADLVDAVHGLTTCVQQHHANHSYGLTSSLRNRNVPKQVNDATVSVLAVAAARARHALHMWTSKKGATTNTVGDSEHDQSNKNNRNQYITNAAGSMPLEGSDGREGFLGSDRRVASMLEGVLTTEPGNSGSTTRTAGNEAHAEVQRGGNGAIFGAKSNPSPPLEEDVFGLMSVQQQEQDLACKSHAETPGPKPQQQQKQQGHEASESHLLLIDLSQDCGPEHKSGGTELHHQASAVQIHTPTRASMDTDLNLNGLHQLYDVMMGLVEAAEAVWGDADVGMYDGAEEEEEEGDLSLAEELSPSDTMIDEVVLLRAKVSELETVIGIVCVCVNTCRHACILHASLHAYVLPYIYTRIYIHTHILTHMYMYMFI
jgi:hypothetical protein